MENPRVTALMSVFNGDKYLSEAIDSILNQTFTNFEFLIVNDGSNDRTEDILKSYNDARIRLINNDKNMGLAKSLNKGLKIARGEYIARMDADDISLPTRLERQVEFLDKNEHVGLLGTSWYAINGDGERIGTNRAVSGKHAVHFICHGSIVMRKRCLEKVGFYREVLELAEDYDLWLRISEKFDVSNLSEPLYMHRAHVDSVSTRKKLQQGLVVSLALQMAEERRKKGDDKLSTIDQKEGMKLRNQRLGVSGIERAKRLSQNYATWSAASFAMGHDRQALHYAISALKLYHFNGKALRLLLKSWRRAHYGRPFGDKGTVLSNVNHFLINLSKQLVEAGVSLNFPGADKIYWNRRADDIDGKWGGERDDYELLGEIITSLKPDRLLDFGCGSGRLFPLYHELGIPEVVAQDISTKALRIAKNRYTFSNIKITNDDILAFNFDMNYFDIIISNRVVQHIAPNKIEKIIKKLTELGKIIYVNELCNSEYSRDSFYLFKHNYSELFAKYEYQLFKKGMLGKKIWYLFRKNR
jgi:glycosyltransferase involved in cell wall biosynthesis